MSKPRDGALMIGAVAIACLPFLCGYAVVDATYRGDSAAEVLASYVSGLSKFRSKVLWAKLSLLKEKEEAE